MADDIVKRLSDPELCMCDESQCHICAAKAEIERLRAERAVTDRPFQVQPGDRTLSFGYGPDGVTIDFDADGRAFRVIVNGIRFVEESRD